MISDAMRWAQITERGDPVAEVSERLSVSRHSLYAWKRQLAQVVSGDASKDAADPTVEARTGPGDQGPTSRKSESQPYAYRMLHYFREPKLPIPMSRQSCGRNKIIGKGRRWVRRSHRDRVRTLYCRSRRDLLDQLRPRSASAHCFRTCRLLPAVLYQADASGRGKRRACLRAWSRLAHRQCGNDIAPDHRLHGLSPSHASYRSKAVVRAGHRGRFCKGASRARQPLSSRCARAGSHARGLPLARVRPGQRR
ncbi:transposase [Novosphingobium sp.]|uniref:transposase n=1 Tax=Novosphingobium sp. TaxID=1874826 RepID=UPI003FA55CA1